MHRSRSSGRDDDRNSASIGAGTFRTPSELLDPLEIDRHAFETALGDSFGFPGSAFRRARDALLVDEQNFERVKRVIAASNSFDTLCAKLQITEPLLGEASLGTAHCFTAVTELLHKFFPGLYVISGMYGRGRLWWS